MKTYSLALTKIEKEILYRKYRSAGCSSWEAQEKIKTFCEYLHNLVVKLMTKNKSKGEIEKRFRQEFEEMCQKLEV